MLSRAKRLSPAPVSFLRLLRRLRLRNVMDRPIDGFAISISRVSMLTHDKNLVLTFDKMADECCALTAVVPVNLQIC